MHTVQKIFLLVVFVFSFAASFAASKEQADALYEQDKFAEAASIYETLLKTEGVAAEVYYNLGNCYSISLPAQITYPWC